MKIIAENIERAVEHLNATQERDFQLDGNMVIEYPTDEEAENGAEGIEWSWEEETHPISGKTIFKFYC